MLITSHGSKSGCHGPLFGVEITLPDANCEVEAGREQLQVLQLTCFFWAFSEKRLIRQSPL